MPPEISNGGGLTMAALSAEVDAADVAKASAVSKETKAKAQRGLLTGLRDGTLEKIASEMPPESDAVVAADALVTSTVLSGVFHSVCGTKPEGNKPRVSSKNSSPNKHSINTSNAISAVDVAEGQMRALLEDDGDENS